MVGVLAEGPSAEVGVGVDMGTTSLLGCVCGDKLRRGCLCASRSLLGDSGVAYSMTSVPDIASHGLSNRVYHVAEGDLSDASRPRPPSAPEHALCTGDGVEVQMVMHFVPGCCKLRTGWEKQAPPSPRQSSHRKPDCDPSGCLPVVPPLLLGLKKPLCPLRSLHWEL